MPLWNRLALVIYGPAKRAAKRYKRDDRAIISTLVLMLREQLSWRNIPAETGCPWATCRLQILTWTNAGKWDEIVDVLRRKLPDGEALDWRRLTLDPSVTRQENASLLSLIERHLKSTGMSASVFGGSLVKSTGFVARLRNGGLVRRSTYNYLMGVLGQTATTPEHLSRKAEGLEILARIMVVKVQERLRAARELVQTYQALLELERATT